MRPNFPTDSQLDAARQAVREWTLPHLRGEEMSDGVLVMLFREIVAELLEIRLRIHWRSDWRCYAACWYSGAEPSCEDEYCAAEAEDVRVLACAGILPLLTAHASEGRTQAGLK